LVARCCAKGTVSGPLRDLDGCLGFLRADCKKLSCPVCGPKKAKKYRAAIGKRAEENRLTRLMTLTLDPKRCGAKDSVSYLRKCFSKFRVSLLRRLGKTVSFIAIVELQKSGMAHLHVLIGIYIDQAWISKAWQSVGGGQIVDIRLVDVHRVNAYLTKYLTKDLLQSVPASKKRISTSRDIHLFEKKLASGWNWARTRIEQAHVRSLELGHKPERITEDDIGLIFFFVRLPNPEIGNKS
jgi:hypothetical protein